MLGDFNAKVGRTDSSDAYYGVVSSHVLGTKNECEDTLLQFCVEQQLMLVNTLFQQHNRRLYMWKLCDGHTCIQTDYILIEKR